MSKQEMSKTLIGTLFLVVLFINQAASAMEMFPTNLDNIYPPIGSQISLGNDELCGVGPDIEGSAGDSEILVRPMGASYNDADNVQWAVDNVASGGDVILCEGVFNFGLGSYEGKSVTITQGIRILGKKVQGEWLSIVEGGEGEIPNFHIPDKEIGPFYVYSPGEAVTFEKVWLRKFKSEAIIVRGVEDFQFINSKLTEPIAGSFSPVLLGGTFVHAIAALGQESKGKFILINNDIDLTWKPGNGVKPSDVQFTGIYGRPIPAFNKIVVSNNKIVSPDEAIEIISNDANIFSNDKDTEIYVENNDIDVHFDVAGVKDIPENLAAPFLGQYAIIVTGNRDTSRVYIRNNNIRVSSEMDATLSSGLQLMAALGINGENFLVENNDIYFDDFPGNAINIGGFGNLWPALTLGTSLYDSTISNNTFTGKLEGSVIKMALTPLFPNYTRNNIFDIEESLEKIEIFPQVCTPEICGPKIWKWECSGGQLWPPKAPSCGWTFKRICTPKVCTPAVMVKPTLVDATLTFACENELGDMDRLRVKGFPERPCLVPIEPIGGFN